MKVINLKNNKNIRDLGGKYKGVTIKEGMLIRGRTLLNLTQSQQDLLVNKYNVHSIIDLRSIQEELEKPEQVIPGTNYYHLPVFKESKAGISREEAQNKDKYALYRALPTMDVLYDDMLHGQSLANLGLIVKVIITADEGEYGFYFHCSEGKDRTGLLAAILLLILGVSKEEVIKDYLYTNKVARAKAFKYYMIVKYLKFDPKFAVKIGRIFLAKREYIEVLFNVIKKEYNNDKMAFFTKGLDLEEEEISLFKERMIVKK